ncbi:VOC family protein [Actinomadura barringtoniae]|uniref:VOC family protein n=1 Tax=Actinomadura barringtoniae TaxID=1427535 RepID=A0A939PNZ9_9ACTN|nr:VOC family protein [Actinomadura barringtoniae]MBO2455750.1 VOC family protein [Actinomadura barringtoniae]
MSDRRVLDHVGMNVPDLEEAVAFFSAHFAAKEVFRLPRIDGGTQRLGAPDDAAFALVMLDIGGARVELIQWWSAGATGEAPPRADLPGGTHLGIEVDDVPGTLAALESVPGVGVVGRPVTFAEGPTPGMTNAFVTTPWGCLIELLSWGQPQQS